MNIPAPLLQEIIAFLTPLPIFRNESGRSALLISAGLSDMLPKLNNALPANEFVPLLLNDLREYGFCANGEAAVTCLLRGVSPMVGIDKQRQIQEFCDRLTTANRPQSSSPSESQKPLIGRDAHKFCDRDTQKFGFFKFFDERIRKCPHQPQFYWLHGEADECLESFIDRLKAEDTIKAYAPVRTEHIPWPRTGSLDDRKEMLTSEMRQPFRLNEVVPEHLAETLSQCCLHWKYRVVIIAHDIHAADWNAQNERFVRWYISECWGKLECRDDLPQFLIFFNMIYPVRPGNSLFARLLRRGALKTRIAEQLRRLHETSGEPDPCQMLEEFQSVQREDVHNWFIRHGHFDELARLEILDSLFQEQGHPVERKPMKAVQKALEEFIKKQERFMMERESHLL